MWIRFEGPGKLHVRRWHRVKESPTRRRVTLCGRYIWTDQVIDLRGEGPECISCNRAAALDPAV